MPKPSSTPIPLRVDAELDKKIEEAARLTGLAKSDVMRLALRIGFEDLKRINYDVAGAVVDAARPAAKYPALRPMESSKVAEEDPLSANRKNPGK